MQTVVEDNVAAVVKDPRISIGPDTVLIGDGRVLDSLALVELCLRLEDVAVEMGFEFDWTSDAAMSRSRSMFRTVASLSEEFDRQRVEQS